ncbi:MAG: hypothetical protein ACKO6R_04995, partial [Burkholderiaceae bacterium]
MAKIKEAEAYHGLTCSHPALFILSTSQSLKALMQRYSGFHAEFSRRTIAHLTVGNKKTPAMTPVFSGLPKMLIRTDFFRIRAALTVQDQAFHFGFLQCQLLCSRWAQWASMQTPAQVAAALQRKDFVLVSQNPG